MPVEGEVKRESKAGPEAADDKQQVGQQGSRFRLITANRSLKIERDEAPDPDVKHVAGEATGTRAERYTVGTIEVGRRENIG